MIAWTPEGGWERDGEAIERLDEDRHRFELEYWRRQPVVIFRRLALGMPPTRIRPGDAEGRFDVLDAGTGELIAQFAVNASGEPIKWGASIGDREFEHVFGPLKAYGDLRLPAWGATTAGIWRYEHESAALSAEPLPVSLEPPSGAISEGTRRE